MDWMKLRVAAKAPLAEGVTSFLEKRAPQWRLRVSKDLPAFPDVSV